jgi:CheY-like chemotaxis protein
MDQDPVILVAEDDELIRALMCEVLVDHGFAPVEAASTAEALKQIEQHEHFGAAFIDIDLGDRAGGYLVARTMRRRRPGAKIVYTSGGARADYEHERVEGAVFVQKPYLPDRVCTLLAERIG